MISFEVAIPERGNLWEEIEEERRVSKGIVVKKTKSSTHPLASPFAKTRTSGLTSGVFSMLKNFPVRPNPDWTSSMTRRMLCLSQMARTARRKAAGAWMYPLRERRKEGRLDALLSSKVRYERVERLTLLRGRARGR